MLEILGVTTLADLEHALTNARLELKSEGYQMSIGELATLYQQHELSIDPEFQRNLRWNSAEKVSFIESVLMGFPLPSIFVAATHDGKWDLLDGLQRITTVFQFMGILRDSDGNRVDPLPLQRTDRFPELEGVYYESNDNGVPQLNEALRRDFKRQRMDVKIILRESSPEMKYDLFLRLATGGTPLSAQDARNAVMANVDSAFRTWVQNLANEQPYLETLWLSDRDRSQRYHEELLLTFLLIANDNADDLQEAGDIEGGLSKLLSRLVLTRDSRLYSYDRDECERVFTDIFGRLAAQFGDKAFEPAEVPAVTGLQHEAFIVMTAALTEAWRHGALDVALEKIKGYWVQRPQLNSFCEAVLWGRGLVADL